MSSAPTSDPPGSTSSITTQQQQPPTTSPDKVSSLPPEAVALAGKLFDLARQGDTPALDVYLAAGIPANLTNHKGDTLLMLAAYHGHAATVRALLARGADPDVLNDRGQSPLAGAVFKGYDEVVEVLVAQGADRTAGQPNAVEAARMFKREGCLRLFGVKE